MNNDIKKYKRSSYISAKCSALHKSFIARIIKAEKNNEAGIEEGFYALPRKVADLFVEQKGIIELSY